ncbi:MAG: glycosyltransferase, partial [Bdellovibrionaceae bacterium]|nr:glycosyltransferase [Pseudobdellovibrionaceae bacterium]
LILGIHDLNPWGGQERSNLEINYRLSTHFPIELHAYTFNDVRSWPQLQHIPYSAKWSHPMLLKFNHYHLMSLLQLQKKYLSYSQRRKEGVLIQSTGTALPISDVIQVQFVHKSWYEIQDKLKDQSLPSDTLLRNNYEALLKKCNLLHEKLIYTNNKKYIAISHSVKKDLMTHYNIKSENISVIYHGVNASEFRSASSSESQFTRRRIRQEQNISDDACVLLTVGALNERKGIHTILKVLKELVSNDFKSVVLLAVGAGDPQHLMNQAQTLGIASHIHLVSAQKDIAPFYQASDIFFFPSLYEPFGLVILEAMASGLPVLTSSVSGAAELITPNIDGIVFSPECSTRDLASEISSLAKDPQKLKSLGAKAHSSSQEWTWDSVAKNYMDFYKAL